MTIGRLIEPFTRPLNEREKEIAPREATMSQLSRERERKRGAKRRAKSKITSVFLMVLIFLIFLIFLVFGAAKNGILAVSDLESHHRARGNCPWVFWDPLLHIKLGFAANPLFARGRGSTATKTVEK